MNSPSETIQISRPQASDDEHREKLQRLVPCRGKLSPEDAKLFREIFREICKAHIKVVWSYLRSWRLPREDAEDLLQETFISLQAYVLDVRFPDDVAAFLMCVAERKVLNYLRGERRAPISLGVPSSRSEVPFERPGYRSSPG
jgi:DNA-directed RNA polymerase specialized sigma24 family protein